jgi:hypothetical protein
MKIEKINSTDYFIYDYFSEFQAIIECMKRRLSLSGFYRVLVCSHSLGTFLQIHKLEDSYYHDTLDLKIESSSFPIYFCTKDYFLIQSYSPVYYLEKKYYCIVDDSFDKILEKVEFGDFVFGEEIENCLQKSLVIQ